jgi:two-component system chemotaxis response regulator CheB
MPRSALQLVDVDYVLPASDIGQKIVELMEQPLTGVGAMAMADEFARTTETISDDFVEQERDQRVDELTPFTCPDCGGSLWQFDEVNVVRYQCHVGHTFQGETLLRQKSEEVEAALWSSLRLLKERATLTR